MDYLKILHKDSNLAADFDALFDFFLLDEPTERDEIEGKCTFSMDGKAFARDGAGGEYHQLEDGSIGYMSSEGECGRIAESIDDLICLLVYSICWHDYCDSSQYTDVGILESYAKERYAQITSYTDMDNWEMCIRDRFYSLKIVLRILYCYSSGLFITFQYVFKIFCGY